MFIKTSYVFYKRILDIVFSFSILFFLFPIYLIISILIIRDSRGPIIFSHKRLGKNGKIFKCYKFRTMYLDSEKKLHDILNKNEELKKEFEEKFKLTKDPRITSIGKFLRRTSLDELPQFLNVLLGQMSVIGPRPIVDKEQTRYGKDIVNLLSVKPGITGLWQVEGRSNLKYSQRKELDLYYVENKNFIIDLFILCKTILVIFIPSSNGAF